MSTRMLFRITCLLALLGAAFSQSEEVCTDPSGQAGVCINLKTCISVMSYLQSLSRPWPPTTRGYLLSLHCGFDGKDPKICCSSVSDSGSTTSTTASPPRPTGPPPPPNVESHPNLRLLPRTCGTLDDDRLFGGNKTGLFEFPWMALISYNTARGLRFSCGSTVINSRYVLTAAHCVTNLGGITLAGVRVGEHDVSTELDCEGPVSRRVCSPGVQDFTVAQAIPHPSYIGSGGGRLPQLQNDIALIRVNGEIDFNKDNALPICLPTTRRLQEVNLDGMNVVVAGWGATENGPQSPQLLKVTMPVVPNARCGGIHNRSTADGVGFRQLCAGGTMGVDSCGGDSGGPLKLPETVGDTVSFVQYGVVSYGPRSCGTAGVPGVYTRVAYYMDWILDQLKP